MILTPAFWIAIGLITASAAIFIILAIVYKGVWSNMQGFWSNVGFFLLTLLLFDLLYYASFDFPAAFRPNFAVGFILFDILVGLFLTLYIVTVIRFFRIVYLIDKGRYTRKEARVSRIWNWDKGLSGVVAADTANAIGVLAGVGAHAVFASLDGWWWVGQFGALLALIIGISIFQRWLVDEPEDNPSWWNDDQVKVQPGSMLNVIVGILTLISLMVPSTSNASHVIANDIGPTGLTYIELFWFILLAVLFIIVLAQYIVDPNRGQRVSKSKKYVFGLSILIGLFLCLLTLVIFHFTSTSSAYGATIAGDVIGILAALAWIGAEFWSFVLLTKKWRDPEGDGVNVPLYLNWEKNIWQVVGAIIIVVFLAAKINQGDAWANNVPFGWTLTFALGASLAAFGTIRGILLGLMNRFLKQNG